MIETILSIFNKNKWTWRVADESVIPDETMIRTTLDKLAGELYSKDNGTQLSLGRLIVMRKDVPNIVDVYMMVGSIEKESND